MPVHLRIPQCPGNSLTHRKKRLIIEVHPTPEKAMSDGYQTLTPEAFRNLMAECKKVAEAVGRRM